MEANPQFKIELSLDDEKLFDYSTDRFLDVTRESINNLITTEIQLIKLINMF